MEIQISPTKRLVRVRPEWLPVARLWEGQTRDGMHIAAFLLRIYVVPSRRLQPEEIPEVSASWNRSVTGSPRVRSLME